MSSILTQGLIISAVGLTLTFFGLALLILIIIVLERLFRPQTSQQHPSTATQKPATASEEEVAAAIAIALTHIEELNVSQNKLGTSLEAGRGPWWSSKQHAFKSQSTKWRT